MVDLRSPDGFPSSEPVFRICEKFHEVHRTVVAFVTSILIGVLGVAVIFWYGTKRRQPGDPLSWGQAFAAATYLVALMWWWYGIVPQQWMAWADNELEWNAAGVLLGPGATTLESFPVVVNKMHVRDFVIVNIYTVAFAFQIWMWAWWNKRKERAEAKAAEIPTSTYGRPLVRKG